jgi:signal transduction histidine kinase
MNKFLLPMGLSVFHEGVLLLDSKCCILDYNESARIAYEISEESIGRTLETLKCRLHPEDFFIASVFRAISEGKSSSFKLINKDQRNIDTRVCPYQIPGGSEVGAILTFSEASDRTQDRRRLERALKTANMAWWEWDLVADKFDLHAEGDCILGYECWRRDFTAAFWFEKTHPDDVAGVRASLDQFLSGKTEKWDCEHRFARGDSSTGEMEWVHELAVVVDRSPEGAPLKVEGSTRNIHWRKLLELDVLASKQATENALELQKDVFAVISHELRTPLNGVYGMSQLLESELEDESLIEDIRAIRSSAEELLVMVDNMIEWSSIQRQIFKLQSNLCDLVNLVNLVIRFTAPAAEAKAISVKFVSCQGPRFVQIDEFRLRQVLTNILSNSVKFSREGAEVRIFVQEETGDDGFLEFVIEDDGVGMNALTKEQLFQPFRQSDMSSTRRYSGAGIGLSVSRKIVRAMEGDIRVESEEGGGTKVTFSVKFAHAPTSSGSEQKNQDIDLIYKTRFDAEPEKIIVVDQHPASSLIATKLLKQFNLSVVACGTPLDAEKMLKVGRYRAIFIDLSNMNAALALVSSIRNGSCTETHRLIPIFGCTSDTSRIGQDDPRTAVFDAVLYKPIRMGHLQRIVTKYLTRKMQKLTLN